MVRIRASFIKRFKVVELFHVRAILWVTRVGGYQTYNRKIINAKMFSLETIIMLYT